MDRVKLVIIGSGPAGYTAAIYASRANLEPVVYEGFHTGIAGGQLMITTDVENFPGFPEGIMGPELVLSFRKQAERFGTQIIADDVVSVDMSRHPYKVQGNKSAYLADAIIIATGASANRLDIPGTRDGEFWQRGVTACAVCDGAMPIFRNKDLYVIGGGDSACEEAIFLTKFGGKIYIVHRRDELRASKIMQQRAINHPKIEILWDTVLAKVDGDDVDALLQVGTNLSMIRLAARLEQQLQKPVIAINTATYWHALRVNGVTDQQAGFGRLFSDF